ncbi:MAG: hypothetical protein KAR45_09355, partial [Desulfobacteraceae bacterium]|nr:hypothetical protein [Desulfobacteraceae bacterium]
MDQSNRPNIYWVLQDNQVTPLITDFLGLLKQRISNFATIKYLIPSHDNNAIKIAKKLNPTPFEMSSSIKPNSIEGFNLKKELIGEHEFSEGLSFW